MQIKNLKTTKIDVDTALFNLERTVNTLAFEQRQVRVELERLREIARIICGHASRRWWIFPDVAIDLEKVAKANCVVKTGLFNVETLSYSELQKRIRDAKRLVKQYDGSITKASLRLKEYKADKVACKKRFLEEEIKQKEAELEELKKKLLTS